MNPTYDGETAETWLRGLETMRPWNVKHILTTLAYFDWPESLLDVGCGDGIMVETARKLGVRAYGIDQLVQPEWPTYFYHQNLVDAFRLEDNNEGKVDIVMCLEVAEHIHETAHGTLLDTIIGNLKDQGHIVFSAAPPGQDGTGHVATRQAEYWRRELTNRGMTYSRMDTVNLALLWSHVRSPLGHLAGNLQVFER